MIDHDSAMGRYRIHLPASPVCGRWETMLVDALDQRLSAEDQAFFDQHRAVCANCAALLDQSSCGRQWLACLDTAPEPPGDLMDRILRQTGPGLLLATPVPQAAGAVALPLVWQRPVGRLAWLRRLVEPRLVMTAAMAFFFHRADAEPHARAVAGGSLLGYEPRLDARCTGTPSGDSFHAGRSVLRPPQVSLRD